MCTYVQKHQKLVWCQADGTDVFTGALLFLLEFCISALLPSRQRSPLPAGQGSHRSDLHLSEVEGCQVALPRFPVHPLTAETADWERSWLGQSREEEKWRMFRQESRNERGRQRAERSSRERGKWHDRQAEWHAVINTYRWLHFMWVQTCFDCYCILPTNIAGDVCNGNIMDEISTRAEKSPGISFGISLP